MKMKAIKLSEEHYVIVDESEIKEGDWILHSSHGTIKIKLCEKIVGKSIVVDKGESSCWTDYSKKIICSTDAFKEFAPLTINDMGFGYIPLSEVEEAIYGYSVDNILDKLLIDRGEHPDRVRNAVYFEERELAKNLLSSYKELVKNKLFTVEDVRKMYDMSCGKMGLDLLDDQTENNQRFEKFMQQLLPRTEWEVEFDEQGKLKLL